MAICTWRQMIPIGLSFVYTALSKVKLELSLVYHGYYFWASLHLQPRYKSYESHDSSSFLPHSTHTSFLPSLLKHKMLLTNLLVTLSMAIASSKAGKCDPNPSSDTFIIGTDGPAPPETLGYFINHIGLLTTNLDAMKDFYGNTLGMRLIFDVHLTPEFTITYMGHAQGGRNGTGFQTGAEMNRDKNNLAGLLELVQFNVSDDTLLASTKRTNTFGHVGLVVPDIQKTQDYLESRGVKILKRYGEPIEEFTGPVVNAFGLGEFAGAHLAAKKALMEAQGAIGLPLLVMVADPDGNLVEIQQQEQPDGVV